ncbi:MAG: HDIG domain-containing protein [Bacteroidetes bacterium]|nr:HDIG domain-containing protein [Bacteroidota bacterium]
MNSILSKLQHNYYETFKIVLFILAAAIVVWISPKESIFKYEFQVGKPWNHKDLIAPFDFSIQKSQKQIEDEKAGLLAGFMPYFAFNPEVTETGLQQLMLNYSLAWASKSGSHHAADSVKMETFLLNLFKSIENKGIIRYDPVIEGKDPSYRFRLIKGNEVTVNTLGQLYDIRSANDYAKIRIKKLNTSDSSLLQKVISQSLLQNVFYDESKTLLEQKELLKDISLNQGLVQKDELIISTGELVSTEKYQVLISLKNEYEKTMASGDSWKYVLSGMTLLILMLFLVQYLFIRFFKGQFYYELKYIVLVLFTQMIFILTTYLVFQLYPDWSYMIPYAILPIVISAFLDGGIAIVVYIITLILVGFYAPNSFEFLYTQCIAGLIGVFSVKKLSKRSDLFRGVTMVFIAYMVVYAGILLAQEGSIDNFSRRMISHFAASSILLLLAFPLIFLYEKMFGLITQLTLLELSNTNNVLLRDLSIKAPGTFQHSLQVANLASEALYEIGGDEQLARTGALYHDIGKMNNPLYFVENQTSGYNPHDELGYEESARVIIDHVLDGIEMARKHGLPEKIIDFIRTHHGTRRVEYFYRLEKKLNPGMEVDQSEFTYHGPAPFSRETAVVMMADSVEAASRSLAQPDEQKINDLVDNIIHSLMTDNQFMNANITMKEITKVIKVLKKKLLNIHHSRIAYPD